MKKQFSFAILGCVAAFALSACGMKDADDQAASGSVVQDASSGAVTETSSGTTEATTEASSGAASQQATATESAKKEAMDYLQKPEVRDELQKAGKKASEKYNELLPADLQKINQDMQALADKMSASGVSAEDLTKMQGEMMAKSQEFQKLASDASHAEAVKKAGDEAQKFYESALPAEANKAMKVLQAQ